MRAPEPDTEEQAPDELGGGEPPPEAVEEGPLPLKPPSAAPPAHVEPWSSRAGSSS